MLHHCWSVPLRESLVVPLGGKAVSPAKIGYRQLTVNPALIVSGVG